MDDFLDLFISNLSKLLIMSQVFYFIALFTETRKVGQKGWYIFTEINDILIEINSIKPGPKPNKPDGTPDRRRRVTPEIKPKHPALKPHIHKPKD